jgi:hypothetical protein
MQDSNAISDPYSVAMQSEECCSSLTSSRRRSLNSATLNYKNYAQQVFTGLFVSNVIDVKRILLLKYYCCSFRQDLQSLTNNYFCIHALCGNQLWLKDANSDVHVEASPIRGDPQAEPWWGSGANSPEAKQLTCLTVALISEAWYYANDYAYIFPSMQLNL